jgi:transcriptional regulator with XRE-family HTH domain
MSEHAFKQARRERGFTQREVAARLGVSQSYVALLERGKRTLTPSLARKASRFLNLGPSAIPCEPRPRNSLVTADSLAKSLSALGYPGFAHLRAGWKRNPSEVLVEALRLEELDSRVAEALPWVLLNYPDLDRDWLLREARLHGLTNRLGFLVSLALRVLEQRGGRRLSVHHSLHELEQLLSLSRLEAESSLGPRLSATQQEWVRQNRSEEARQWHVLTTWRPEHLQYA